MLASEECPEMNVGKGRSSDDVTLKLRYWHQRADERHGSPPPR